MDPNEALRTAREAVQQVRGAQDADEEYEAAVSLADSFAALDGWLTKGGFLPQGWMPPSVAPTGTQAEQDARQVFRLRDTVRRVLLKDEALEARWSTGERFLREVDRLADLVARWLVQAQREEAELVMRMMDSSVTRQFISEQAARLATEPVRLLIDNDGTLRRDET